MLISEMSYVEGISKRTNKEYALVKVRFESKAGQVLGTVFFPEASDFENKEDYEEELYRAWIWLESIAAAYVKPSVMVEAFKVSQSPEAYIEFIWRAILSGPTKNSFVRLKTLPDDKFDAVVLPKFPFFISSDRTPVNLRYTVWETEFLRSWFIANRIKPHISLEIDESIPERKIPTLPENLTAHLVSSSNETPAFPDFTSVAPMSIPLPPGNKLESTQPTNSSDLIKSSRPADDEIIQF